MATAMIVVGILLALIALGTAFAKLTRQDAVVTTLTDLEVPESWYPWLAAVEIAGALGVLIGLVYPPLGIAAAIGLSLYFVGAILTHLRKHDLNIMPPAVILVVAVAATALFAANV